MNSLVPTLINCLQYTQEDLLNLDSQKARKDSLQSENAQKHEENGEDSDDEEGGHTGDWTTRKEAARALDLLSRHFGGEVFLNAQEKIASCLQDENWVNKYKI